MIHVVERLLVSADLAVETSSPVPLSVSDFRKRYLKVSVFSTSPEMSALLHMSNQGLPSFLESADLQYNRKLRLLQLFLEKLASKGLRRTTAVRKFWWTALGKPR